MLFNSLVVALASGLVLETLASPLSLVGAKAKREVPFTHSLHERHLSHLSNQWTKKSKVPDTQILPMRIGLKQSNLEAGHDKLMDISTPGSENYGKHMSPEEIVDFFAPEESTIDAVTAWLAESGIGSDRFALSVNKQWIQFDATTGEAEDLLIAEFFVWEHVSGTNDISTEEYHIPTHIREHIDYVTPGTRLRQRAAKRHVNKAIRADGLEKRVPDTVKPLITQLPGFPHPNSSVCDIYVTAECTRVQYSIPNATTAESGNQLGIFESLDVHYSRKDLDIYFSTLYPNIPNGTYPEEDLIDGAIGAIEDTTEFVPIDLEAPLDFDSSQPLIYPQKLVLFQEDDEYYESTGDFNGFWNTFLDAIDGSYCTYSAFGETGDCTIEACLDPAYPDPNPGGYKGQLQCGVYKPTNVISISYGGDEAGFPDFYMKRQCNEWMKLALQGTTIVMSSGDSGVGGPAGTCNGAEGNILEVDFASTCPYVLSVGSTEWDRFSNTTLPVPGEKLLEVATKRFPSGGGFSNVFGVQDYQRDAVSAYFDQVESSLGFSGYHHYINNSDFSSVTGGIYHHGGRGYPDVGAVGDRQVVYSNGSWWLVGGTSLSSPVFASVLTLINEARLAAGKSTVGFIHPVIYQHPEAFNDITSGSNPGCGTPGFPAAKGWDPVTGLGSPNFPVLMEVLMGI
ncbi:alkaline serine protease [Mollisia scopiformis]|uniref:tripeptidyl-peptidase II n=1 Tax=Mollisia scopiformis TaxID=149040 RepID=A0A194X6Y2_MOLSC|nr:alkaline serine protease [Mollisia scopiformis]KUJ15936.1 alkaline serine protease [Mollisia scopiformis]